MTYMDTLYATVISQNLGDKGFIPIGPGDKVIFTYYLDSDFQDSDVGFELDYCYINYDAVYNKKITAYRYGGWKDEISFKEFINKEWKSLYGELNPPMINKNYMITSLVKKSGPIYPYQSISPSIDEILSGATSSGTITLGNLPTSYELSTKVSSSKGEYSHSTVNIIIMGKFFIKRFISLFMQVIFNLY